MDDAYLALQSFGLALLIQGSFGVVSLLVSPRFFPEKYELVPHQKKLWHTTVMSIVPATVVPFFAVPALLELLRTSTSLETILLEPPNPLLLRGVGVSCAHFVLDSAIMLFYSEDFIKALRRPLYIQMMLHHIASVLVWPYALYRNKCCLAVAYYMCSECSNISLLVRWFVTECGIKGPLRMAADATFFITYTLIRFVPCFIAAVVAWRTDWLAYARACTPLDLVLTTLTLVPFGLNLYWYTIVMRSLRKVFAKKQPPTAPLRKVALD